MPNGCGPSWMPRQLTWLFFGWWYEASCDKHDDGYKKGGNEVRRFECDWKLLLALLRDCKRVRWYWKPLAYPVAILYFVLVRLFGWYFFQYKTGEANEN